MSTWWVDYKKMQIFFFSRWLFEIIHIIRFEMHMDGRINLKIFLGYNINYLSIWPFMCHSWFPTRKASKLTFFCFQLQLFTTLQGLILHFFVIHLSSRHEKSCRNKSKNFFPIQCSRNQQWVVRSILTNIEPSTLLYVVITYSVYGLIA